MLESKRHAHFWYFFDFSVPNSINDLVRRGLKELVYLFLPEDTTDKAGDWQNDAIDLEKNHIRSIIKVVVWAVISIIISLAVGQLQ